MYIFITEETKSNIVLIGVVKVNNEAVIKMYFHI